MSASATETFERSLEEMRPVRADDDLRKEVMRMLSSLAPRLTSVKPRAKCRLVGADGDEIEVPEAIFKILVHAARVLARGDALTLVPLQQQLTTRQAADVLNVSRQYLVRLLDEQRIPFTKTGAHRRVRLLDLLAFKDERDRKRRASLKKLTELSEEFGGYKELE
ncbi:MAG: helix-turn-helix domain-containing protein [Planctomycetes bacterium]|nr:helix-turn-helix domain-containing protein [Planctomycetota bacterium]